MYPFIKNEKDINKRLEKVKETGSWRIAQEMKNFSYENFYKLTKRAFAFSSLVNHQSIDEIMEILGKEIEEAMSDLNTEYKNKVVGLLHVPEDKVDSVQKAVDYVFNNTKHLLKKNPTQFFKYWCKVIVNVGEKAERKILKMIGTVEI